MPDLKLNTNNPGISIRVSGGCYACLGRFSDSLYRLRSDLNRKVIEAGLPAYSLDITTVDLDITSVADTYVICSAYFKDVAYWLMNESVWSDAFIDKDPSDVIRKGYVRVCARECSAEYMVNALSAFRGLFKPGRIGENTILAEKMINLKLAIGIPFGFAYAACILSYGVNAMDHNDDEAIIPLGELSLEDLGSFCRNTLRPVLYKKGNSYSKNVSSESVATGYSQTILSQWVQPSCQSWLPNISHIHEMVDVFNNSSIGSVSQRYFDFISEMGWNTEENKLAYQLMGLVGCFELEKVDGHFTTYTRLKYSGDGSSLTRLERSAKALIDTFGV